MNDEMFFHFGLVRAARVVIDLGEDIATLSLASELLARFRAVAPSRLTVGGKRAEWILVVRDQTLIEQFAGHLLMLRKDMHLPVIRYFSPERAVIRHFLAGHPLFLGKAGAGIHALVVGSGRVVDELIKAIYQTSLVADQKRPRITVVSARPTRDRSAFFASRPSLIGEVDVVFLDAGSLDDFEPAVRMSGDRLTTAQLNTALRERDKACPVTDVFLMRASADANTRQAVKIKQIQAKTGRLNGKLFGYDARITDQPAAATPTAFDRQIEGYQTFGLDDRFLENEFCKSTIDQTLAFALHEDYRSRSRDPVELWDGLSETDRRSNHNAADHALAKLHMLGFDVANVPPGVVPSMRKTDQDEISKELQAPTTSERVHDAIVLEHDRWMLERRFDGWVYGSAPRDKVKLTHHLLVPWDELNEKERDKDKAQIEAMLKWLSDKGDQRFELRRRVSPATTSTA